jgi:hypothetical protein
MLTETGTTTSPMLVSAQRWADYIDAEFAHNLADTNPIAIEPGVDEHGDHQLTIAGVTVPGNYRHKAAMDIAAFVASKLAAPIAYRATLEWHDYPYQLISFIGWIYAEWYIGDSDGFASWLNEFKLRPAKWTVEYIVYQAALKRAS